MTLVQRLEHSHSFGQLCSVQAANSIIPAECRLERAELTPALLALSSNPGTFTLPQRSGIFWASTGNARQTLVRPEEAPWAALPPSSWAKPLGSPPGSFLSLRPRAVGTSHSIHTASLPLLCPHRNSSPETLHPPSSPSSNDHGNLTADTAAGVLNGRVRTAASADRRSHCTVSWLGERGHT